MANGHGGKRPGGGRPRKTTGPVTTPPTPAVDGDLDVLNYLIGVALGKFAADTVRVQAAKAALAYTTTKKRGPLPSPHPSELARTAKITEDSAAVDAFEAKARVIRERHGRKQ